MVPELNEGWNPPPQQSAGQPPTWSQPLGAAPGWAVPVPQLPPPPPREYPWFWRSPDVPWWKPLLAVILGGVGFMMLATIVTVGGVAVDALLNPGGLEAALNGLLAGEVSKPLFIANSIALACLIPLAFLMQRLVGQCPGYLSSVVGRVRWGWLGVSFGISMIAILAFTLVGIAVDGVDALGLAVRPGWLPLLLAIVVVTPFQSAGEEYLVRGLLNRAVASWIPLRVPALILGAVVSSGIFMLMHAAADPWLNLTYFTMGLLFCHLAWRTGGLEASIALHAANNLVGLGVVPFQEWGGIFDRQAGSGGPEVLFQLVFLGLAVAVIEWVAVRRGLARTAVPILGRRAPQPSLEDRFPT